MAGVLLRRGWTVRTLTNRRPAADEPRLEAFPLAFAPEVLAGESVVAPSSVHAWLLANGGRLGRRYTNDRVVRWRGS